MLVGRLRTCELMRERNSLGHVEHIIQNNRGLFYISSGKRGLVLYWDADIGKREARWCATSAGKATGIFYIVSGM